MRLRLGHAAALDEQTLGAVHLTDILNALLQTAVFALQAGQTAARGARHAERLHEQYARERLGYDEHAIVLDLFGNTVRNLGLSEQDHAGKRIICSLLCHIMPEFIGQRRVDEYEVEQSVHQHAPGLRTGGSRCKLSLYAAGR